jgi:hypothetical protein
MTKPIIETFPGYEWHSVPYQGSPYLRGWKYRKTMCVIWSDGTLFDYIEFNQALDHEVMGAALKDIWQRYLPQCDRRALCRGGVHGHMFYVPIAAGVEAMAVVRQHFEKALAQIPRLRHEAMLIEESIR